jgi:hypothetical protein
MIDMKMRAQHEIHILRSQAGGAEVFEIRPVLHVIPRLLRPLLVVAAAGIHQDHVARRPDDEGMKGKDQQPGLGIAQPGFQPRFVAVERRPVGVGKEREGVQQRAFEFNGPLYPYLADLPFLHSDLHTAILQEMAGARAVDAAKRKRGQRTRRREVEKKMVLSTDRILTTHAGSMPRGEKLTSMLVAEERGEPYDRQEMVAEMDRRVGHVLEKQRAAGIDIPGDGEQPRVGFQAYITQRMTGRR